MNDERVEDGERVEAAAPITAPLEDDAIEGDAVEDESIATAGGVAAAGRRAITEDWAATILGLTLLVLALAGVIGKGMVP